MRMFLMHFGLAVLWLALVNKWTVIAWSYEALSTGLWPSVDHNGEKFHPNIAGEVKWLVDHRLHEFKALGDLGIQQYHDRETREEVTEEKTCGACTVMLKAMSDRPQLSSSHDPSNRKNWKCRYGCCLPGFPEHCHRWLRTGRCSGCCRKHSWPPWMADKTRNWWSKQHRPRSFADGRPFRCTEGGPQSQNLKRTLEKADEEGAMSKRIKDFAGKESTLDELEAAALEGVAFVKSEPEDSS